MNKYTARKDFQQYKSGELTKEHLKNYCWLAQLQASLANTEDEFNDAYEYLEEMQNLGFIKGLHRVD